MDTGNITLFKHKHTDKAFGLFSQSKLRASS